MEKTNVWIDTDPGVDDVFAMILACFHDNLNVVGISAVAGDSTVENTVTNVLKTLEVCGLNNIDVIKGADSGIVTNLATAHDVFGNDGLCENKLPFPKLTHKNENWIYYMYKKIMSLEKKTAIIAIGPLTNVGLLIKCFPDIKEKISEIVFMGGSIGGKGNITPEAEFNLYNDPEAAFIVLESGIELVMIPLELGDKYELPPEIEGKITALKSNLGEFLTHLIIFDKNFHQKHGFKSMPIYDPFASYYLISKQDFVLEKVRVDIELRSDKSRGKTYCDMTKTSKNPPNVHICIDVNSTKYWETFIETILKANTNSK